jgi:hypothetical protein
MLGNLLTIFAAGKCSSNFFGLVPWYEYLKDKLDSNCDFKDFNILPGATGKATDVPLILAAIVDDLLRIAGFIALAFVIVGAIRYITSQGDPEATGKAQETIINALIGLAVTIVGVAFISFLGNKIGT